MKRSVLLLALVLLLGCLTVPGYAELEVTPEGTFPIVNEPMTLRVMTPNSSNVEDFTTNDFTKYYEELTGITVEWIIIPAESKTEKVNISLSSNDLPDVYQSCSISQTQQQVYGSQGAFVALNDYIDKYGSIVQQVFENVPNCREMMTMSDGNIYALPRIEKCQHCEGSFKMWVNRTWMEKLGIEPPTTVEEFEAMLVRFKEEDPNGNGVADEIPLISYEGGWNSSAISGYLMNPFVYTDSIGYLEDGQVKISYLQPGWKEGLAWLHSLYEQGLYYDQSLVINADQATQIAKSGADGATIVGAYPNGVPGSVPGPSVEEWVDYVCIPALEGPAGQYATWTAYSSIDPTEFVLTVACPNPSAAFRWEAEMYNLDLNMRKTFGVEGVNWRFVTPGEGDVPADAVDYRSDDPAQIEPFYDGVTWSDRQNFCWRNTGVRCDSSDFKANRYAQYIPGDYDTELEARLAVDTRNNMEPYYPSIDMVVPPLVYTEEQAMELANIEAVVQSYRDEMAARFITGDADIETEWDAYIAEMEAKGALRLQELYQQAYDAKYASQQ